MNKIFTLICLFIFALGTAQNSNFSKALLIDDSAISDKIFRKFHDENMAKLYKLPSKSIVIYNWDSKNHKFGFSPLNTIEEKPTETVIFLIPSGSFELNPEFKMTTDSVGNTLSAYFELKSTPIKYLIKHIDVSTSKVLKTEQIEITGAINKRLSIFNPKKEFGSDPNLMQRKSNSEFQKILAKIRESYAEKIVNSYNEDFWLKVGFSKLAAGILSGSQDYFVVTPQPNLTEKKLKRIKFKGGINDNLIKSDNYKVLVKRDVEKYFYYEDLCTVYVDDIGETESEAKTFLLSNKDMATSLANNEELLMVKENNVSEINRLNFIDNVPKVNIAINKKCMFCNSELESRIYESPIFNLVERNAPELKYFADMTKNEKFIDYSIEDLQGKKLGYELLLIEDDKFFQVIEVKSNKTISSFPKKYSAVTVSSDNKGLSSSGFENLGFGGSGKRTISVLDIKQSDIQRFLSSYNGSLYKVEWVQTLEEKKEKINKILVYHPAGMDRYMEYNFYTLLTEEVDGENIERKNKIGRGKIGSSLSPNLSELKIKDGEKEIYKAKKENTPILIEVSDGTYN